MPKSLTIAGVMSGTSADGIDVALVELAGPATAPRWRLAGFRHRRYSPRLRAAILAASGMRTPELARLDFELGRAFGAAVLEAKRTAGVGSIDLVASHGQTVFHQGGRATLQLGEAAVIAARAGAAVVANFRAADIAAGGQGAPLAPWGDWILLRDRRRFRVGLNLGGIANVALIPPAAAVEQVVGFDTGPGNMVLDACMRQLTRGRLGYDRGGALAVTGEVNESLLRQLLRNPFFRRAPPKSAGREQFGAEFTAGLLARAKGLRAQDVMATATALTARTVAAALPADADVIMSGGGAKNRTLVAMLRAAAPGCSFAGTEKFGIPSQAKEALLFALLGYAHVKGTPASLPRVTGARYATVLGDFTPRPMARI